MVNMVEKSTEDLLLDENNYEHGALFGVNSISLGVQQNFLEYKHGYRCNGNLVQNPRSTGGAVRQKSLRSAGIPPDISWIDVCR